MAKMQMITVYRLSRNSLNMAKQIQLGKFRASNLHAIGTYDGKQEHGMLVLNALNKTPSLNFIHKLTDLMIASMQKGT